MRFYEILNEYIEQLGCMAKDICERSGISAATLSRYRSGERLPALDSDAFDKLCLAIANIAIEKGITSAIGNIKNFVSGGGLDSILEIGTNIITGIL